MGSRDRKEMPGREGTRAGEAGWEAATRSSGISDGPAAALPASPNS